MIDAEICPELREGLYTVMSIFRNWYPKYASNYPLVKIEAPVLKRPSSETPARSGFFFSGGIDSLATLRANRLNYPLEHPGSIKDGILVYGLEVTDPKAFEHVVHSNSVLAKEAGITMIPVFTNIRDIGPERSSDFWNFWMEEFMAAAFSAIAHTLSKRLCSVTLNSDRDLTDLMRPFSSHPLVNPYFSTSNMKMRLEGIAMNRFQKTKLISDWDLALQNLRVCNRSEFYQPGKLNCGECEKCIRTKVALIAVGALERSSSFLSNKVTAEMVAKYAILSQTSFQFWKEMIAPLNEIGRYDLVKAIKMRLKKFYQEEKKNL
jgi:hypothetical protein